MDERLNKTGLVLRKLFSIASVDRNVAQGCGAIVLNVNVRRREKLHENGNGASIDQLLSVVICELCQQSIKPDGRRPDKPE